MTRVWSTHRSTKEVLPVANRTTAIEGAQFSLETIRQGFLNVLFVDRKNKIFALQLSPVYVILFEQSYSWSADRAAPVKNGSSG